MFDVAFDKSKRAAPVQLSKVKRRTRMLESVLQTFSFMINTQLSA